MEYSVVGEDVEMHVDYTIWEPCFAYYIGDHMVTDVYVILPAGLQHSVDLFTVSVWVYEYHEYSQTIGAMISNQYISRPPPETHEQAVINTVGAHVDEVYTGWSGSPASCGLAFYVKWQLSDDSEHVYAIGQEIL